MRNGDIRSSCVMRSGKGAGDASCPRSMRCGVGKCSRPRSITDRRARRCAAEAAGPPANKARPFSWRHRLRWAQTQLKGRAYFCVERRLLGRTDRVSRPKRRAVVACLCALEARLRRDLGRRCLGLLGAWRHVASARHRVRIRLRQHEWGDDQRRLAWWPGRGRLGRDERGAVGLEVVDGVLLEGERPAPRLNLARRDGTR